MADASESKAIQYCQSKGWGYKETSGGQVILDNCPFCGKPDHFYMATEGRKDGLYECKKCLQSGNLFELQKEQGDREPGMQSQKDWAGSNGKKVDDLPNVEACHERLLNNDEAMEYLTDVRGFDPETIIRMKLGLKHNHYFRHLGKEVDAIVIPYLKNGRITFAKYRSFPPNAKDFSAPAGWEASLYNVEAITEVLQELVFVEGEYDCLSCLSNGVVGVVGVPGAGVKKSLWVDLVEHVQKKYILYDPDEQGRKGAQELAEKLGLDNCYKVTIPPFTITDSEGNEKPGKDINDWFRYGDGKLEKFELLLKAAKKFDVQGVVSVMQGLDELEAELEGKEKYEPKYITSFDPLNWKLGGFNDGNVIDILAPAKVGKSKFTNALINDLVARYDEPGMFICGEMTVSELSTMWMSLVTLTDMTPGKTDAEKIEMMGRMRAAIPHARRIAGERIGDTYYSNPKIRDLDELYKMIYNARRRYGVKFFGVDNLQLFADRTLSNPAFRTIHLSKFSKELTAINKELGTVMFRVIQPKKLDNDKVANQNDTDGSSQIDKDCDALCVLHRPRINNVSAGDFDAMGGFIDEEVSFGPELLINVALCRYAPGGRCTLTFDGATSSVSVPEKQYANLAESMARGNVPSRRSPGHLPKEEVIQRVSI